MTLKEAAEAFNYSHYYHKGYDNISDIMCSGFDVVTLTPVRIEHIPKIGWVIIVDDSYISVDDNGELSFTSSSTDAKSFIWKESAMEFAIENDFFYES